MNFFSFFSQTLERSKTRNHLCEIDKTKLAASLFMKYPVSLIWIIKKVLSAFNLMAILLLQTKHRSKFSPKTSHISILNLPALSKRFTYV